MANFHRTISIAVFNLDSAAGRTWLALRAGHVASAGWPLACDRRAAQVVCDPAGLCVDRATWHVCMRCNACMQKQAHWWTHATTRIMGYVSMLSVTGSAKPQSAQAANVEFTNQGCGLCCACCLVADHQRRHSGSFHKSEAPLHTCSVVRSFCPASLLCTAYNHPAEILRCCSTSAGRAAHSYCR